jgi:hypothetical protein
LHKDGDRRIFVLSMARLIPEPRTSAPAAMLASAAENPLRRGNTVAWTETRACLWCSKPIVVSNGAYDKSSGIKTRNQRYCDRSCSNQGRFENPTNIRRMKPVERAYLAALIDGEGSVNVIGRRSLDGKALGRRLWRILISNTDLNMIQWCAKVTGVGNITVQKRSPRYKDCYRWTCHASTARAVLEQCEPYMITKREKALEAIADLRCLEAKSVERHGLLSERQASLKLVV